VGGRPREEKEAAAAAAAAPVRWQEKMVRDREERTTEKRHDMKFWKLLSYRFGRSKTKS